jgi:23S rRNA (cytosine1962-C5)-methyltransferase
MNKFSPSRGIREGGETWISEAQARAFAEAGTTAHRLCTGPGGWVERLGDDLLVSFKDDAAREAMHAGAAAWCAQSGLFYQRIFGRLLPRHSEGRIAPTLLEGPDDLPIETQVKENGMTFEIDFSAGYSAGLFLDQRHNRAFVRRMAAGRMLNTFAYTCSFSVAAAIGGTETLSIDLSKKSLARGRANFELNGLDPAHHRFIADDVLDALPRLARRGERFDCIILDPPTFSRGNKGQRFQVEHDLESLLAAALELAAPKASVLLSTNCSRIEPRALESIARFALKTARLSAAFHREPQPPDIPARSAAQTLWLLLR